MKLANILNRNINEAFLTAVHEMIHFTNRSNQDFSIDIAKSQDSY